MYIPSSNFPDLTGGMYRTYSSFTITFSFTITSDSYFWQALSSSHPNPELYLRSAPNSFLASYSFSEPYLALASSNESFCSTCIAQNIRVILTCLPSPFNLFSQVPFSSGLPRVLRSFHGLNQNVSQHELHTAMQHLFLLSLSRSLSHFLVLVRFLAFYRIKSHAPPLSKIPANSFYFPHCYSTPPDKCFALAFSKHFSSLHLPSIPCSLLWTTRLSNPVCSPCTNSSMSVYCLIVALAPMAFQIVSSNSPLANPFHKTTSTTLSHLSAISSNPLWRTLAPPVFPRLLARLFAGAIPFIHSTFSYKFFF